MMASVYRVLKSTKTAAILALLMIPFLIVGTVIPQNQTPEVYKALFSPGIARIITSCQIHDVYHSVYFLTIASLFLFVLIIGNLDAAVVLIKSIQRVGIKTKLLVRLSIRLLHLSLLIMVIGFVLTAITKVEGRVVLKSGERAPLSGLKNLELKLNRFWIDYMEFNGQIYTKDYYSDIELFDEGKLVAHKTIEVNNPLKYHQLRVYQAFYKQYVTLALLDMKGDTLDIQTVETQRPVLLKGLSLTIIPQNYQMGNLYFFRSARIEKLLPRIPVVTHSGGQVRFIGYLSYDSPLRVNNKTLILLNAFEASGVTYRKDGGVAFVFIGTILAGVFSLFAVMYRIRE